MTTDFSRNRPDYGQDPLQEDQLDRDPIRQFESWIKEAFRCEIEMPNAMVLATASADGKPSARFVLLKSVDEHGFVLYSHSTSAKGMDLAENPRAALVFYWRPLHRQVRVEGRVSAVADADADAYFEGRPHGSRVSAWVAPQSSIVAGGRDELEKKFAELSKQYPDEVPRPATWVGYRVEPERIEFWQGRESRLHDRILYSREGGEWRMQRLAP